MKIFAKIPSRWRWAVRVLFVTTLSTAIGVVLYLSSPQFEAKVRDRIVTEMKKSTGAEVELQEFHLHPFQLAAEISNLRFFTKVKGKAEPFASFDKVQIQLKLMSLAARELGLRDLTIEHPVIKIHANADGTLDLPTTMRSPPAARETGVRPSPIEPLFSIAMDQFTVRHGELEYNDRAIPLEWKAHDVSASVARNSEHNGFFGNLAATSTFAFQHGATLHARLESNFKFDRKSVTFTEFRWTTRDSRVEGSGAVADYMKPVLEFDLKAHIATNEAAALLHQPGMSGGAADIKGHLEIAGGRFSLQGGILTEGMRWQDANIRTQSNALTAQFKVDQNDFVLNDVFAQIAGGTARGNVVLHNWLSESRISTNGKRPAVPNGDVKFNLLKFDTSRTFADISQPWLPLQKLNAVGTIDGTVNVHWSGLFENAAWGFDLQIAPAATFTDHQLPVEASLRGTLYPNRKLLDAEQFRVHTPQTTLTASGPLGFGATSMKLDAEATSLAEWAPMLVGDAKFPIELNSQAKFHGALNGTLADPVFNGSIESGPFKARFSGRNWSFDGFNGEAIYSREAASVQKAILKYSNTVLKFNGNASLKEWALQDDGAFVLEAETSGMNAKIAQTYAGTDYPLEGDVSVKMSLIGSLLDFHGSGTFDFGPGSAYGELVRSAHMAFGFRAGAHALHSFEFSDTSIQLPGGAVQGSGYYDQTTGTFRYNASTQSFTLSQVALLKNDKLPFEGTARFEVHGTGTLQNPVLNADISVQNIKLNGEWLGDLGIQAQTRGGEMKVHASSKLIYARLTADGTVNMSGDLPTKIDIHCTEFNLAPVVRALSSGRLQGTSSMNGSFRLTGPARYPKKLKIEGDIDQLAAEIEGVKLTNVGPMGLSSEGDKITVENFHVSGQDTDLNTNGSLSWSANGPIDLRLNGSLNLKLLQGYSPGLHSSGTVRTRMRVAGTRQQPKVAGSIDVNDATVSFIDLPNGLTEMNGHMEFNEDRLEVRSLNAKTGGGSVKLGGYITYHNELYFDLAAEGRDIRFRYPAGVSSAADADLRYIGTTKSSLLSGTVTVTRLGLNPHFDFAQYIVKSQTQDTSGVSMGVPQGVLENLKLDVHVVTASDLHLATALAKISGNADLHLRGTVARPAVLGRVSVADGQVYFNGTQYRLERGDIQFTNPVKTEPSLNLEATARVRDYDITVGFHGPMDRISVTYRSEPPLPAGDVIALLALGRTREDAVLNNQPSSTISSSDSDAVLGEALNATLSSRVQKLFGVSRIKIDPQVGGPENNPNARITIEQQVNKNITLTYITNLSQSAQQIIQAEYAVNPDLSVIAVRDQNGVLGFDVRVRKRRK